VYERIELSLVSTFPLKTHCIIMKSTFRYKRMNIDFLLQMNFCDRLAAHVTVLIKKGNVMTMFHADSAQSRDLRL